MKVSFVNEAPGLHKLHIVVNKVICKGRFINVCAADILKQLAGRRFANPLATQINII